MPDRLHWNTVKPILKEVLTKLMQEKLFDPFRLVGGTSLSLQLGHRMSDDIDLFTDEAYGSLDFTAIDKFTRVVERLHYSLSEVTYLLSSKTQLSLHENNKG